MCVETIKTEVEAIPNTIGKEWRNREKKHEKLQNGNPAHKLPEPVLLVNGNCESGGISYASTTVKVSLSAVDEEDDNRLVILRISLVRTAGGQMRKKLLVLDLNGLLVDIVSPPPKDYKADVNIARRAIFKRPFCLDFLKFCFERFEVGVWSSRTKKNMERVIYYLMGDMKHRLLFCWDLSRCTSSGFRTLENKHKALVFKELSRIWEKRDPDLPWEEGKYNVSNTLLLDDSPYKALLNPPHTAVFPHSYKFQDESDTSLGARGDLRLYLERLAECENIPKFVEQQPFGQTPISEGSSSWDFYCKVMNTLNSFPSST